MENNDHNYKVSNVSARLVTEKRFQKTDAGGYDPDDVDSFLDLVIETLSFYETNFQRYQSAKATFESMMTKVKAQAATIQKLQTELSEMYNNGYSNQLMIRRIQTLESSKNNNHEIESRLSNIENLLSKLVKNST